MKRHEEIAQCEHNVILKPQIGRSIHHLQLQVAVENKFKRLIKISDTFIQYPTSTV